MQNQYIKEEHKKGNLDKLKKVKRVEVPTYLKNIERRGFRDNLRDQYWDERSGYHQ
jgi:hypothetical protein